MWNKCVCIFREILWLHLTSFLGGCLTQAGVKILMGLWWYLPSLFVLQINMLLFYERVLVFKILLVNHLYPDLIYKPFFKILLHSTILCCVTGQLSLWSTTCWRRWWRWTAPCSMSWLLPTKQSGSGEEPWTSSTSPPLHLALLRSLFGQDRHLVVERGHTPKLFMKRGHYLRFVNPAEDQSVYLWMWFWSDREKKKEQERDELWKKLEELKLDDSTLFQKNSYRVLSVQNNSNSNNNVSGTQDGRPPAAAADRDNSRPDGASQDHACAKWQQTPASSSLTIGETNHTQQDN